MDMTMTCTCDGFSTCAVSEGLRLAREENERLRALVTDLQRTEALAQAAAASAIRMANHREDERSRTRGDLNTIKAERDAWELRARRLGWNADQDE